MAESFYYQRTKRLQPTIGNRAAQRGIEVVAHKIPLRHSYIYNLSFNYTKMNAFNVATILANLFQQDIVGETIVNQLDQFDVLVVTSQQSPP
jgi:hypothetical protein